MSAHTEFGRSVLDQEAAGISQLAGRLGQSFDAATDAILACTGHVVVAGVGKPWLIGQKISATLASTGTPSFALHPTEAMHGDLGRLREHDLLIAMSNSGTSVEMIDLVAAVRRLGCRVIGITANEQSPLAEGSDLILNPGKVDEACPIGMAPSVSTTVMLALGDALALTVMKARQFSREEYAQFHPGGALGRSLMRAADVMQDLDQTATVDVGATVTDALNEITRLRTGAAFVVSGGELAGVFTDGDLRRHIRDDNLLTEAISRVMTAGGVRVQQDTFAPEIVRIFENHRIGEVPVVDAGDRLVGHISLKDLVSMHFL